MNKVVLFSCMLNFPYSYIASTKRGSAASISSTVTRGRGRQRNKGKIRAGRYMICEKIHILLVVLILLFEQVT